MIEQTHIIGSGAIGSLLAANAQLQKMNLVRHVRDTVVNTVTLRDGENVHLNTAINDWQQPKQGLALVILPLKSYQIVPALEQYLASIPTGSAIVLMHNGMGCFEHVANLLANHYVFLATTSHGAFKPSNSKCIHTGLGTTNIGTAGSRKNNQISNAILSWFEQVIPPVTWQANIYHALWHKLAINALINPLTALHDIRNGELLDEQFTSILEALAGELANVTDAEGIELDKDQILTKTNAVIEATASNYSSMHQDVKHQKRTEIDAITGYILQRADKHAIKCPTHRALYEKVVALLPAY